MATFTNISKQGLDTIFLMTEGGDYLMTESSDYLIIARPIVWADLTKTISSWLNNSKIASSWTNQIKSN